jgi:hypothetical protein
VIDRARVRSRVRLLAARGMTCGDKSTMRRGIFPVVILLQQDQALITCNQD